MDVVLGNQISRPEGHLPLSLYPAQGAVLILLESTNSVKAVDGWSTFLHLKTKFQIFAPVVLDKDAHL
jgi:hypothetical protein